MVVHEFKTDPFVFDASAAGIRQWEIRNLGDRDINVGDIIWSRRTKFTGAEMKEDPVKYPLIYTGEELRGVVQFIGRGLYVLPEDWGVLSVDYPRPSVLESETLRAEDRMSIEDLENFLSDNFPMRCMADRDGEGHYSAACRVDKGEYCGVSSKGKAECGMWIMTDVYPEREIMALQLLESMKKVEALTAELAAAKGAVEPQT